MRLLAICLTSPSMAWIQHSIVNACSYDLSE
jgi:hypothetical protein